MINIAIGVILLKDGDLRLVGCSSSAGRLEIYHNNEWGTICDDDFGSNSNAATVACRQLGFTSGSYVSAHPYGYGLGQIWLDDVTCSGSETSLTQCTHGGWGIENCDHYEDVAVTCTRGSFSTGGNGKICKKINIVFS